MFNFIKKKMTQQEFNDLFPLQNGTTNVVEKIKDPELLQTVYIDDSNVLNNPESPNTILFQTFRQVLRVNPIATDTVKITSVQYNVFYNSGNVSEIRFDPGQFDSIFKFLGEHLIRKRISTKQNDFGGSNPASVTAISVDSATKTSVFGTATVRMINGSNVNTEQWFVENSLGVGSTSWEFKKII